MPGSTTRSADTSATSTSPWRCRWGRGIRGARSRRSARARGVPVKDPPKTLSQSSSTCCSASTARERRSVSTRERSARTVPGVAPRTPTRRSTRRSSSSMRCARLSLAMSSGEAWAGSGDRGERAWLLSQIWSLACRFSMRTWWVRSPPTWATPGPRHRTAVLGARFMTISFVSCLLRSS